MKNRFVRNISTFHRGQMGITGLETAIILIAFVTVAAVLAYSVLSAGIFSSEKGQQAVYAGLGQAKASMQVVSGVKALSTNNINISSIQFSITSVLDDDDIDLGKVVMHYTDAYVFAPNSTYSIDNLASGGSDDMLRPSEVALITINMSDIPTANLVGYDEFTLEVIPPTGATITIQRKLPGYLENVIDLH